MKYELHTTNYGYIIMNGNEKYVMNRTKKAFSKVDFYLKKVHPTSEYISGLFYNSKKKEYKGKTRDNRIVKVYLGLCNAIIEFK